MSLRFLSPRAPWHKESVSEDAVRYDLQLRLKYALEKGDMDEVQACVEVGVEGENQTRNRTPGEATKREKRL